ncbi:MAG TPA: DUF2721 domain-containing protein [Alphaproteobacteria bacterium]|jgi:hypothetical protein|nr:DUF2721 domain-containing protein [Alphaproteobacteria bacterium]
MADLTKLADIAPVESAAHLIQTALTPVFMLSAIGTLLNVFNTRLARVSDHMTHLNDLLNGELGAGEERKLRTHLKRLVRRTAMLDASIALGAVGGASTCGAALVLFVGSIRDSAVGSWLIGMFAVALVCTVASLVTFMGDSLLAWHGLRREGPLPKSAQTMSGGQ